MLDDLSFKTISELVFGQNITLQSCSTWVQPNHLFMQFANLFILLGISFVISSLSLLIFLRIMLLLSNVFMMLWALWVICSRDVLFWNAIFAVVNILHFCILFYKMHPFISFPHEVEMIYRNMFSPLRMTRYQFSQLYDCSRGIQTIKAKDTYARENETIVDSLSLLLSGRLSILRNGTIRHLIDAGQFIESPEWFGMSGNSGKHQVTIVALEESQILVWNRDKLKLSISSDRYLQTILDSILCKDIVKKLMLSLDIEASKMPSEKTKLISSNYSVLAMNTPSQDLSHCFWNLSSMSVNVNYNLLPNFDVEAHETTL